LVLDNLIGKIYSANLLHNEELVGQCFNLLSTIILSKGEGINFHMGTVFTERSLIIEGTQVDVPISLVDVLSKADVALRQAQTQHMSRYGFYAKANNEAERTAGEWKLVLKNVLQEESIKLHYQSTLDARGETVVNFEVLSRNYDQ
jgi:hypothetical protein